MAELVSHLSIVPHMRSFDVPPKHSAPLTRGIFCAGRLPASITVVTGKLPAGLSAFSNSSNFVTQSMSVRALVDPTLTPGQFRKATATAALASTGADSSAVPSFLRWSLDQVEATFDGQSGQIEIRVDVTATASNGNASVQGITFQVTTLAKL